MTVVDIITFAIIFIAAIGMIILFILKRQDEESVSDTSNRIEKKSKSKDQANFEFGNVEAIYGVHSIKENVVIDKKGYMSLCLQFSTPDIQTMGENQINHFEDALKNMVVALDDQTKLIEITRSVDTYSTLRYFESCIEANRDRYNEKTFDYTRKLYSSMENDGYDVALFAREKYLVIGGRSSSMKETLYELDKKLKTVVDNIMSTGIEVKRLNTNEYLELLNQFVDPTSRFSYKESVDRGLFESYIDNYGGSNDVS